MSGPAPVPYGTPPGLPAPGVPAALLRRPRSALTWVTGVVLGLGALAIAVIFTLLGGVGPIALVTFLAALAFPGLILVVFWLDRYEPEPARYRLAALGWGGVVAVVLSFVAEQLLFSLPGSSTVVDTAVIAPVVEELGKGLFLVAVLVFRRDQIHGLLDGVVYGALVGVGFAFVEDILYYLSALSSGGGVGLTVTFVLRGVMGPFAHPLFTAATGLGVGIGMSSRKPAVRVLAPLLGFVAAVGMHGLWNGSSFWGARGFYLTYAAVMLPLLVLVLAVTVWARSREGRMLEASLRQTVQMGWTRPEEVRWVARLSDRMSARGYARTRGGPPAKAALRAFQQTMIEIAFLHNRAVTGTAPPDLNARMLGLLERADALRPYVLLPPPAPLPGMLPPPPGTLPPPPGRPPGGPVPNR